MRCRSCCHAIVSSLPLTECHSRLTRYCLNGQLGLFAVRYMNNLHVDATHLLSDHDNTRSLRSTADARNGKQLDEAREEVVSLCQAGIFDHALLLVKLCLNIVDISCCLQRRVAESQQRFVSVVRLLFLEVPTRGLRAEVDANDCTGETYWLATRSRRDAKLCLVCYSPRGIAGINADPSCNLQAISPTW